MQAAEFKALMERLAPFKVIGTQREEASYQAIQHTHWSDPGEVHVHSGRHGLIEAGRATDHRFRTENWAQLTQEIGNYHGGIHSESQFSR